MKPITDKQKHAIQVVENILNESFEGATRQDAFLWLREFVPKAEKAFIRQRSAAVSGLHHIASESSMGIPEGLEPYESERTPTKESLDVRIAMDHLFLDRL